MIEVGPSFYIDFTLVTLGAFIAGMILEMLLPLRDSVVSVSRWFNNAALAIITYACSHLFGTFVAVAILSRLPSGTGYSLASLPLWLDFTVVFLVLGLARYSIHVAMHKIPLLWRFHAVHHTDSTIDVFTAFRHHPLEDILSTAPIIAILWLLGSSPEALIIYRALDLIMAVLTHTNVDVNERLERWLRYIVITPAFHRTHHFAEQRFTDSNYGALTPWFDYLFNTYQPTTSQQQKQAKLGLDSHTINEKRIDGMLIAPFVEPLNSRTISN
ncbi:MAG: sterol desaturase/sphingolipid hydroxylase (fatty acid hydroxylase superfamily) [Halioglobus sp.]|jgi:sterol desaturase/sphingolipid hydroxylase (fatty acid hydroxylase superfamily)